MNWGVSLGLRPPGGDVLGQTQLLPLAAAAVVMAQVQPNVLGGPGLFTVERVSQIYV